MECRMNEAKAPVIVRCLVEAIRSADNPSVQEHHENLFAFLTTTAEHAKKGSGYYDQKEDENHNKGDDNSDEMLEDDDDYVTPCRYLEVNDNFARQIQTKRIVIRDCYNHILPILVNTMKEGERVLVTGSPGIGKSLFGLVLLRALLFPNCPKDSSPAFHTVVYWNKLYATAISFSETYKNKYGLNQETELRNKQKLFMGSWEVPNTKLKNLLVEKEIAVVHDPPHGYLDVGTDTRARSTAIIASYGHALMPEYYTKAGMPDVSLCMPCFTLKEIQTNGTNLFVDRTEAWRKEQNEHTLEALFHKFGGGIRHWGRLTEDKAWNEMLVKVRDVVQNQGSNIAGRTLNHRGSIVHLHVDFDRSKPIFPSPGSNSFDLVNSHYVLASALVREQFAVEFKDKSVAELKTMVRKFEGEKGAEAVYGVFFEKYAHRLLCDDTATELNIRVVRHDGRNKRVYASTKIQVTRQVTFAGRDPKFLKDRFENDKLDVGTYLRPESSTFPTYDAIVVVRGEDAGMTQSKKVALLLQMTVSGASGLPRRPEHSVKNHVRVGLTKAIRSIVKDFTDADECVTAFCVPSTCFQPFLFQCEERKDSELRVKDQPKFQFVIELPDFLGRLERVSSALDEIRGEDGQIHRYELRSGRALKRQKTTDLHEVETA